MNLQGKLLVAAIVPLVAALGLIAFALRQQQHDLAHRQQEVVRQAWLESTQDELRHYVAMAISSVRPLVESRGDATAAQQQALARLAELDYGTDGYFFVYDYTGVNLMHPRQPELVGQNLIDVRDANGKYFRQSMIDAARAGGGFVSYTWNKPSAHGVAPKLVYVTAVDRWHWVVGTGVYTDDLDVVLARLDAQLEANVDKTMRWIGIAAAASVAIVLAGFFALSVGELRAADHKLTLLTRQLVRSQEDERAWLSRELHDGTSQMLVSAKLLVESALERLSAGDDKTRSVMQRALARVDRALNDIRAISHRLRPTTLDNLGLSTALRQLGDEMCDPAGIAFTLGTVGGASALPDEIKSTLFRVSQEALTNIVRHAAAKTVQMTLGIDASGLQLSISDDGSGFDTDAVAEDPRQGIGLRNMRERLLAIDGRLLIRSQPGQTVLMAQVPAAALQRFAALPDSVGAT